MRANLQKNSQLTANLGLAKSDAAVADTSLSSATQLMDAALSLAAQGATATTDASGRQAIAGQVEGILEQMVGYANTQSAGRYIFGGDADTSPPDQLDLLQANGVDQLTTAAATRVIQDRAGGSFPASQTAQQIFDNRNPDGSIANDNVFAALNRLCVALLNNDMAGIRAATTSLKIGFRSPQCFASVLRDGREPHSGRHHTGGQLQCPVADPDQPAPGRRCRRGFSRIDPGHHPVTGGLRFRSPTPALHTVRFSEHHGRMSVSLLGPEDRLRPETLVLAVRNFQANSLRP